MNQEIKNIYPFEIQKSKTVVGNSSSKEKYKSIFLFVAYTLDWLYHQNEGF